MLPRSVRKRGLDVLLSFRSRSYDRCGRESRSALSMTENRSAPGDDFRTFLLMPDSCPSTFQHLPAEPWLFGGSVSVIAIFQQFLGE